MPSHQLFLTPPSSDSLEQNAALRLQVLQTIVDRVPVLIDWYDAQGRLQWVNREWERTLGWTLEEARVHNVLETLALNQESYHRAQAFIAQASGESREFNVRTRDGSTRQIAWSNVRLADGSTLGIGQDVTQHHQSMAVLQASEERFRLLVERAPIGITIARDGINLHVNQAYLEIFGYTHADEIIGVPLISQVAPQARATILEYVVQRERGEHAPTTYESIGLRKDGTEFPYSATIARINLPDGPASVAFIADITALKHAEAERIAFERNLLETQKLESLGLLAGGVAHDFNNLLTSVLGNASLLLRDIKDKPEAEACARQIVLAARQAADLTRQLLAYAGKGPMLLEPVDFSSLINDMCELLRASVAKTVRFQLELPSDLHPIMADITQLRQVVMNVLINAAEAIGEVEGTVTLRASNLSLGAPLALESGIVPPGDYIQWSVADTGIGMNSSTLERIFEPFYSTKFAGRGLGLAAVQGIVRSHHAMITVASTPGRGTTFTVFWPVSEHMPPAQEEPTHETRPLRVGTALVVDDEPAVRRVLTRILEECGLAVLTANDGVEGVQMFHKHATQLVCVFLDLTMPKLRGDEALRQMQHTPNVPIIIMSGYGASDLSSRFAAGEIADVLTKPFSVGDVRRILERVLVPRA